MTTTELHEDFTSTYGPWAVVAGGSEGVGSAFATRLARAGVHLVLIARGADALEEVGAQCREHGVEVRTLAADLTSADDVARICAATDDLEVGLLVYNAGSHSNRTDFLDSDPAAAQRVIDLNITAPLAMTRHFGARMRERRRGGILLVGSLAGHLGAAHQVVYSAAKAFSRIFSEGLWLELRDHNVHVLHLVLGVTRTPAMVRAGLNFDIPGMPVSEPDEVAAVGLAELANGPVVHIGDNASNPALRGDLDRAKVVLGSHKMLQKLTERARQRAQD
ncbi:SDR family NAD(P)-dependent oxidoreductase [Mycolicibacterium baixiangningiae]|uniref:SDR family NAD(P)-dependent oxidoreductase n=1 Tax=Mycolicibacterium baixiangningiae TaxID=2761578 RepID=UPI0018D0EE5F|nr:SDR family NAD(P)-dependent oxidoreductase [Mycolicibacterium baixiangningiae]